MQAFFFATKERKKRMTPIELLLTAVALSMDAVAVSLSCGLTAQRMTRWQMLRIALCFGIFQALMPAIGYLLGSSIHQFIEAVDHWIAFGLLLFIGGRMIWEQWRSRHEDTCKVQDMTQWGNLLLMGLATSIDALAVGIGLAMTQVNLLLSVSFIGVTTFMLSGLALVLGRKVSGMFSKYAGALGGVILIGIGINILVEHLLAG